MKKEINISISNNFVFWIPEMPILSSMVHTVTLPPFSVSPVNISFDRGTFKLPSDKIEYSPLSVSFFVDENYDSYMEAYNWLQKYANPHVDPSHLSAFQCDCTLFLLNNNWQNARKFTFQYTQPAELGELEVSTNQDGESLQTRLSMVYSNVVVTPASNDVTGFYTGRQHYNTDMPEPPNIFDS